MDCTLPAVLLDGSRETGAPTAMRIQGELVRQWGEGDRFPDSPIYAAPASSVDEALTLMEPYKEGLRQ